MNPGVMSGPRPKQPGEQAEAKVHARPRDFWVWDGFGV